MKYTKWIMGIWSAASAFSMAAYCDMPQILAINTSQQVTQPPSQNLLSALAAIGVSQTDIATFQSTGTPNSAVVNAVIAYDNNSSSSAYQSVTSSQDDALVTFSYMLYNQKLISSQSIQTLMKDEKLRLGMSEDEIDRLQTLTNKLVADPHFALNSDEMQKINRLITYIEQDPFAFADVIGPLTAALIYNNEQGNITLEPQTEQALIAAAQTLTGLSDSQVDNIVNISNTYSQTGSFDNTGENVADVNQALEASVYPSGEALLYPLMGVTGAVAMGSLISSAYYAPYFADGAGYWNSQAVDNAWNDHENNVNNAQNAAQERQNARQSGASSAQGSAQERQGARQSDANSAQGSAQERQGARQSDANSAQGAAQGRQQNRESAADGAQGQRSSLNRDNSPGRGGRWSGLGDRGGRMGGGRMGGGRGGRGGGGGRR